MMASVSRYEARSWNCARFAHACAEAVCGRELPFRFRESLEGSVDHVFQRIEVPYARRGDVVCADVPSPSLGVCLGAKAAFVQPYGLMEVPMGRVRSAWKVD
jgi:hypothetical protein